MSDRIKTLWVGTTPSAKGNLAPKLEATRRRLREAGARSGVYFVEHRHAPTCPLLTARGPCNCDPEIEMRLMNRQDRRAAAAKARSGLQ